MLVALATTRWESLDVSSRIEVARVPGDRTPQHDCLVRVWHAILGAHARVSHRLEAELMTRSGLSLADYDVLSQLDQSDGRLRMGELADRVLLSRGGLTRLVDRLGADGLVDRQKCPNDARGAFAVLTDAGRRRLQAARPFHLGAVEDHFLGVFSEAELDQLAELLGRIVEGAAAATGSIPEGGRTKT